MSEPRERLERLADRMSSEVDVPYAQCRLTVREFREVIAELRDIAAALPPSQQEQAPQ
jgi:hypothetical protein